MRYRVIRLATCCMVVLASVAAATNRAPITAQSNALIFSRTFDHVAIRYLSTQVSASLVGRAEWGFSAVVEADDARLLFDTGLAPDTVTANAAALHVDLRGLHDIVISHWHRDHTGGIRAVLTAMGAASDRPAHIYVHPAIFDAKLLRDAPDRQVNALREDRSAIQQAGGSFQLSATPREIVPGMVLTGSVPRVDPDDQKLSTDFLAADTRARDTVPDEQSLVINTRDGLIVLTGCGHAGIVNTVQYVKQLFPGRPIHAVVGGFHWFASSEPDIVRAGDRLRTLGVSRVVGAHCTLVEPMFVLRQHGWSRDAALVGAIGSDFQHGRSFHPAPADERIVAIASAPPLATDAPSPSCHRPGPTNTTNVTVLAR